MDLQFWTMLLKIIIFLPLIIMLIYISIKYGGTKFQSAQNGKYLKIVERIQISKENSILLVKIGNKAYVMSSSASNVQVIYELTEEELKELDENKLNKPSEYEFLKKISDKLKVKGRFKDE